MLLKGLVVLVFLLSGLPAYTAVNTNMSFPITIAVFIPCAVGGVGETVTLTGNLHVLISTTVNANHISSDIHFQPQGISGVGSVSGDKYQATGITRFSFEADVVAFISVYPDIREQLQDHRPGTRQQLPSS